MHAASDSEHTSNLSILRRERLYALRRAYHGFMLHRGIDTARNLILARRQAADEAAAIAIRNRDTGTGSDTK